MVFRWIYSVTLSFFTVQGGLILQPKQSEENASPQPASVVANSEWLDQLDVTLNRCIEEACKSEAGSLQSNCLANCLRNRLQNSPIVQKARKESLIDAMTSNDLRQSEALRVCLRDQCPLVDYIPQFLSRCVFEKCIGADRHLFPVSTTSSNPQHFGMEGSGSVEQVSSEDRNEEWRREPIKKEEEDEMEDRNERPVYSDRPHRRPTSLKLKRGYSDATDICIAFHCSSKPRGTWGFLKCVNDNRCAGR